MPLSTALKSMPDQLLGVISSTQDMILTTASPFAETTKSFTPALSDLPFASILPSAESLTAGAFSFAEKLLASQKDFSIRLLEAYLPTKPAAKVTTASTKAS